MLDEGVNWVDFPSIVNKCKKWVSMGENFTHLEWIMFFNQIEYFVFCLFDMVSV